MPMKEIMVTGYDGFIGSLLVRLLTEKGYRVTGLDTNFFGPDCEFFYEEKEIKIIKKDTREINEADLQGIDVVCHLAGLSNEPLGQLNPDLTFEINFKASVRLAKLCKKVGVSKFIYSSSCGLYDKAGDEALSEEAVFNPVTAYAQSKVKTEERVLPMGDKGFCVTSLRNAAAYGISSKLRLDLVVNHMVGLALVAGEIKILSGNTPWQPIVHAEDIARAFLAVIEAPAERINQQAFNVGMDKGNYRIKEIAEAVAEMIPICDIVITGEHGSDSRSYRVDFSKIKKQLPEFKPVWNLRKGIHQLHENYLKRNIDDKKFNDRYFIRLKQIQHLLASGQINNELFWKQS
jgi:nucleoside-diphosphate-sugar epimerase